MQSCAQAGRPAARRGVVTTASWAPLGKHTPHRLFLFGLGYTGLGAANFFQKRGWAVAGTCRSEEKRARLAERGIDAFHFDPADFENLSAKALEALRQATHVLSTVPPVGDNDVDPVLRAHAQQLSEHADAYRWVGYISSTSVYGDYQGDWVDEGSELRAAGGKGWARVVAEHEWLSLQDAFGLPVHIFRCGGIYGPRRSALDAVQRAAGSGSGGESASQERRGRQRFTTRCHVLDICHTLEASARHPRPGAAYNIADDDPADRATVMDFAAGLLQQGRRQGSAAVQPGGGSTAGGGSAAAGVAAAASTASAGAAGSSDSGSYDSNNDQQHLRQQQLQQQNYEQQRQYPPHAAAAAALAAERPRGRLRRAEAAAEGRGALEEKRVCNGLIKKELGVKLVYPTYREGLAAIAGGDLRPFD